MERLWDRLWSVNIDESIILLVGWTRKQTALFFWHLVNSLVTSNLTLRRMRLEEYAFKP